MTDNVEGPAEDKEGDLDRMASACYERNERDAYSAFGNTLHTLSRHISSCIMRC